MKMKKILFVIAMMAVMDSAEAGKKAQQPVVSVTDLRTERLVNPMNIDTPTPRLGWRIESTAKDVTQLQYRIIVASTREKAEALEGDLWDYSLGTDQSQWVVYQGKPLRSNTRCYWRVKVLTSQGTSEWSDVAMWNVGLLTESDWSGYWIGLESLLPGEERGMHTRMAARYLRKEFQLKDKEVKRATAYVAGIGLHEFYVNGQRMGDGVLQPVPSDYRKTIYYNTYDITENIINYPLMCEGTGKCICLGIILGNGRLFPMQQHKPYKIHTFGYPKCRINVIVEYTDGTIERLQTDDKGWKITANGPIRANNEYDGEEYDARMEMMGWSEVGGIDASEWLEAERTDIPQAYLRAQMMPGMKVLKQISPLSVKGNIIDVGQNMAGWLKVRVRGQEGDTIRIVYAEKLNADGTLYRDNLRNARSTDIYVCNGDEGREGRWWSPAFVYHGFRYAEITGMMNATADDFVGEVISDEMEETGHFVSTNKILNQVYQNAYWGILSNYKGMPVDCPQRDERQPWLGDRTRGCFGEAFLFDNHNLYAKWARDIVEAQRTDGCIPDVAPAFWNYYSDDLTWAAALPMTLAMLIGHYGDDAPLRKYYPNVKHWLEHLKTQYQKNGLIHCGKYADWCVPPEREDLIHSEDPARKTDVTLISTAYYFFICRMMAGYAHMQKFVADEKWFEKEARETMEAFNREYLTVKKGTATVVGHILYPDSTFYGNNTVTANVLPYYFGMIDDLYVSKQVEKQIVKAITDQNLGTVTCGVIGIGWLLHALTKMERTDLAWLLATNKKYPSWGYMAEHGATTIWELWNGDTASPAMNSGNHVMLLGDLLSWLYENIAGIGAADMGFKHIAMNPDFTVDEIDDIDASYQSIYGKIVSRWKKEHGRLFWHVEIPANTKATLFLPHDEMLELGSGSYDIERELPQRMPSDKMVKASPVIVDEFLYKEADFPECHSASIVETKKGDLVATYFGGTKERNPDVCIWVSRKPKGAKDWTKPVMVADGVELQPLKPDSSAKISLVTTAQKPAFGGKFMPLRGWTGSLGEAAISYSPTGGSQEGAYREACWNPVLFETPTGELQLYFKIGFNIQSWQGWRITSKDGGKTWSKRERLPEGIYGPIKNKPVLVLSGGSVPEGRAGNRLIAPTSDERDGWKIYFELSDDMGKTWRRTAFVEADAGVKAIQPAIITLTDGRLEALCRTRSRHIGVTYSSDNGETWSKLQLIGMPNNNSGIDAVTLQDGTFAIICNDWPIEPTKEKGARTPLSILRSNDGIHWNHWITLEDSPVLQYSYPSIIQSRDGHIHVVYTWRRQRIKHVELKVKE
jgi:alpha-L-rhamnosidase